MKKIISLTVAIVLLCLSANLSIADQTVTLTATAPGQSFIGLPSGNTYKADNQGNINNVHASDVPSLLKAGATIKAGGTSITGTPGNVANFGSGGALQDSGSALGTAAFQPTTAFDASGAAAAVQSYFTGQTGFLSCNGSGCTASPTVPATSVSGLGSAALQPSAAFDASGAASTVKSYFTGQTGLLSCNGSGCTAATTLPASSISGLGSAALQPSTAFDAMGAAAAVAAASATKAVKGATQSRFFDKVPMLWSRGMAGSTAANDYGTSRLMVQAPFAEHDLQVVYRNYVAGANPEANGLNPYTITATFEYPANTFYPLTFGGKSTVTIPSGASIKSDEVGIDLPVGAQGWVRTYWQLSLPPLTPVATAGTGGSLAAATYYYKVTSVCGVQGESGPATEVSAAAAVSGTVSLSWKFDPNSACTTVGNTAVNIYRATASGSETLLVSLPGLTTGWADTGAIAPGTTTVPGNQQVQEPSTTAPSIRPGEGTNQARVGNSGSNTISTSGTSWIATYYANYYVPGFEEVLATPDQGYDVPVIDIAGDSISHGTADVGNGDRGYLALFAINNNIPYYFMGLPGDLFASIVAYPGTYSQRIIPAEGSVYAISEYGINDINGGYSLAQLEANAITVWIKLGKRTARGVYQTTLLPRTTSTNNFINAAGQTVTNDSVRVPFNDWLRVGAPVMISGSTITATTNGTTGAVYAGQPGHPLLGYIETCGTVEVNSSNVLTLDGGLWITNGTANYPTPEGTHPSANIVPGIAASISAAKFPAP